MDYSIGQAYEGKYQYGHPGMYGSNGGAGAVIAMAQKVPPFVRGQRQRLNIVAILISLFVPWLLFCAMYWTMSFYLHYQKPFLCWTLMFFGLCVVIITGLFAYGAFKRKREALAGTQFLTAGTAAYHEPTWLIFLFITCLLAWICGAVVGDVNFFSHVEPYYDLINLNTYPGVDPSRARGQQMMDGGTLLFTEDSKLDLSMSMGFKNLDLYCVAPIVESSHPKQAYSSYDFWAVGMNCCSGNRADFHCGEFNNVRAAAGLRLMHDDQRAFYRLAVQQAEAAYKIRADHPLFFVWMQDPAAEVNAYMEAGQKFYLIGIFVAFLVQLFLVVVCCMVFSKLGGMFFAG